MLQMNPYLKYSKYQGVLGMMTECVALQPLAQQHAAFHASANTVTFCLLRPKSVSIRFLEHPATKLSASALTAPHCSASVTTWFQITLRCVAGTSPCTRTQSSVSRQGLSSLKAGSRVCHGHRVTSSHWGRLRRHSVLLHRA